MSEDHSDILQKADLFRTVDTDADVVPQEPAQHSQGNRISTDNRMQGVQDKAILAEVEMVAEAMQREFKNLSMELKLGADMPKASCRSRPTSAAPCSTAPTTTTTNVGPAAVGETGHQHVQSNTMSGAHTWKELSDTLVRKRPPSTSCNKPDGCPIRAHTRSIRVSSL